VKFKEISEAWDGQDASSSKNSRSCKITHLECMILVEEDPSELHHCLNWTVRQKISVLESLKVA
jgi:hypothetical protein